MTTELRATPKKIYTLENRLGEYVRKPVLVKKESTDLENIYQRYFSSTGCKLFVDLINKFSVADALFLSGNSMVLVEYKKRYDTSYRYYTAILEKDKYDNLISTGKLLNCPLILFINEWSDGVITIWNLAPDDNHKWENQYCQLEDGSTAKVQKQITYLLFENASYILSMKTWNKVEFPVLENYFKIKRLE